MELGLVGGHCAVEVHVVLSEGAGLVETGELDHAPRNHLVLRNAEDGLLAQFLDGVDYAEGHAHGQRRRHCDQDQVHELYDDVLGGLVLPVEAHHHRVGRHRQPEQEEQEFYCLTLEHVHLLTGEQDYPDQLALRGYEVGANHAQRYPVGLAEGLVLGHALLVAHLDNRSPLINKCAFVDFGRTSVHAVQPISLLDHRH